MRPALRLTRLCPVLAAVAALVPGAAGVAGAQGAPAAETKVAFVRFVPRADRLLIFWGPLEGGPRRALRLPVRDAQGPAWSPDGRRIAFVGGLRAREELYLSSDVDLWVARGDGRRARRLTHDGAREAAPAWSPDGRRLVFVRSVGGRSTLWVVRVDGKGARRLTSGRTDIQPAWSPDGTRIVFVRTDATFDSGVWEVRPDGSGLRRILPGLRGVTQPTWSSDGERLLLTDSETLFTMRLDGSDRRLVARLSTDARGGRVDPQPAWSSTGWVVFTQLRSKTLERSDIWRVRPDASGLARVTVSPSLDNEPSTSP